MQDHESDATEVEAIVASTEAEQERRDREVEDFEAEASEPPS